MIQQIIFLMRWPINSTDMQKIDLNYLNQCGYRVVFFILSQILREKVPNQIISPVSSNNFSFQYFRSFQELKLEIEKVAPTSLFIDYVMDFIFPMAKILRRIKKYGGKYFALDGGSVPSTNHPSLKTVEDFLKLIRRKILKVFSQPNLLFDSLTRRLLRLLTHYFHFYPCPDKILSVGSEILEVYLQRYHTHSERIVPIPSHDYDLYIEYLSKNKHRKVNTEKICVFLDVAATHHPDFNVAKIKPFNEDEYFPIMTNLFDTLEKKTGLRVVIASHPYAQYERFPQVFGDREIVKEKTIELVEKSSLVVSHYSTSISFAVLFSKPILVVKTPEMARHPIYSVAIDNIATALGLKATTLHTPQSIEEISFDYQNWPTKFDDYKHKYIKPPGTGDATVWEIVVREIRKLNACPLINRTPLLA